MNVLKIEHVYFNIISIKIFIHEAINHCFEEFTV